MRQHSLLIADHAALAGVMPAIRAAMNRVASDTDAGRDILLDKINLVARQAGIRLTAGNAKAVSRDTLDKWLSPSDASHPPSINAVLAFCAATGDHAPLRVILRAMGLDIMTTEDRTYRDIGRASVEAEAARKRLRQLKETL